MEITNIKIFKTNRRGPVLAYANVIFNNKFIVRGITLVETEKGRFISMPSIRLRDNKRHYKNICHPTDSSLREELTSAIFNAYEEFIKDEE